MIDVTFSGRGSTLHFALHVFKLGMERSLQGVYKPLAAKVVEETSKALGVEVGS